MDQISRLDRQVESVRTDLLSQLEIEKGHLLSQIDGVSAEFQQDLTPLRGFYSHVVTELDTAQNKVASFHNDIDATREHITQLQSVTAHVHRTTDDLSKIISTIGKDLHQLTDDVHRAIHGLNEAKSTITKEAETWTAYALESDARAERYEGRFSTFELLVCEQLLSRVAAMPKHVSPFVSIILPSRNRAQSIAVAIRSVLAQHFTDWELIIIDDGSRDNTVEIVNPFLTDSRIRYVSQRARGQCAARNHGLRLARGELVAYLDSDNEWYPEFLTAAVSAFCANRSIMSAYGALVSDVHLGSGEHILFQPYNRARLLSENYIDINTFVHRRSLVDKHGGFDLRLRRLEDWDLILRYTNDAPPYQLPILAARYYIRDNQRVTDAQPQGPSYLAIRCKWHRLPGPPSPRVLYLISSSVGATHELIRTEACCVRRWGCHIEGWSSSPIQADAAPFAVHAGSLDEAIREVRPNVIHIHGTHIAVRHADELTRTGIPITVRAHTADRVNHQLGALPPSPVLRRLFCLPEHSVSAAHDNISLMPVCFDTSLFCPTASKTRKLVVAIVDEMLPDLNPFFQAARASTKHVFSLVAIRARPRQAQELRQIWEENASPGQLLINPDRHALVSLLHKSHIYVQLPACNADPPQVHPLSVGAMATGTYLIAPQTEPFPTLLGGAGIPYRDAAHLIEILRDTDTWSRDRWQRAWRECVDHAYMHFADEMVLRPLFDEWSAITRMISSG